MDLRPDHPVHAAEALHQGGGTRRIREAVSIPVAASNRINMPQMAEQILAECQACLDHTFQNRPAPAS